MTAAEISDAVARSDRRAKQRADRTPEEAAAVASFYERQQAVYVSLTAEKRAQGHGDCTEELEEATRVAAAEFLPHATVRVGRSATRSSHSAPRRVRTRSRERRSPRPARRATSAASASSSDPDESEPAPRRPLTVSIAGAPSAASDAAVARWLEQQLSRRYPGTAWTADVPRGTGATS